MRGRVLSVSLAVLLFAAIGSVCLAEADEEIYVFTNADLDRLAPMPTTRADPPRENLGWNYVIDFIDRQNARIDADRNHDLDRARAQNEADYLTTRNRGSYVFPYAGLYYGNRGKGGRRDHAGKRPEHFRQGGPRKMTHRNIRKKMSRPIKPLHARRPLR